MTFVHVVHVHVVIQRVENAHTTDPQHGFLAQPVIRISTIEVIGKLSIARVVLRQVSVQQVDRDGVPGDPLEIVAPRPDRYRPAFNRHLDHGVFEHQEIFQAAKAGPSAV